MNKKEYLAKVNASGVNMDRVDVVEKIYGQELNEILSKVVSLADQVDCFDEERRALSFEEIKNPVKYLEFDAVKKGFVPVIDAYDCTYIVYLFDEKKWGVYSVVDDMIFIKNELIEEIV